MTELSEVEQEFYEERAAIMEYDGGMCWENAETEAARLTSIFFSKTQKVSKTPIDSVFDQYLQLF